MTTARSIRVWLILFIVCLVVSGLTAFPLEIEMRFASWLLHNTPFADWMPDLTIWIDRVRDAVIAVAFIGPLRDPVRNIWVIQFGVIGIIPLLIVYRLIRRLERAQGAELVV